MPYKSPVTPNALPFPCRGLGGEGQGKADGREGKGREIITPRIEKGRAKVIRRQGRAEQG
jgi:hypothetical protein